MAEDILFSTIEKKLKEEKAASTEFIKKDQALVDPKVLGSNERIRFAGSGAGRLT